MTASAAKLPIDNSSEIISSLNEVLRHGLAAINQYFLHARMLKHAGYMKLADVEYKESIEQMRNCDRLVERVLAVGGVPNLQDLGKLFIGDAANEILQGDLDLQSAGASELQAAIALCEAEADVASADILRQIQANQTAHIKFINEQLKLVDSMGLAAYLETQV